MSTSRLERHYHCWNDCNPAGCPGHTATLTFQSSSDAFHFSDGKGHDFYGQTPEYGALLSMLHELSSQQVEVAHMIEETFKS